jgi:hypothetical protein
LPLAAAALRWLALSWAAVCSPRRRIQYIGRSASRFTRSLTSMPGVSGTGTGAGGVDWAQLAAHSGQSRAA